jgi:hypothetical protein
VIYPFDGNDVVVKVNGAESARVHLDRGKPVSVSFAVPSGSPVIRFEPRISYVPAELPGSLNLDPRRLAVEMYDLRTSAPAPSERQPASR